MKKPISFLLAGTIIFSMMPFATVGVSAAEETQTDGIYTFEDNGGCEPIRKTVTNIQLASDKKPDFIFSGDTYYFDMSDIEFNVSFSDGNSAVFTHDYSTVFTTQSIDVNYEYSIIYKCEVNPSTSEAVFTMRGKNQTKGVSVTVPINSLEVASIAVEKLPEKTEYVGEQYEEIYFDGIEIRFNYTNGKSEVFDYTQRNKVLALIRVKCNNEIYSLVSSFFRLNVGDNEIFFTFGECSTSINVTGKAVESIEIQKLPYVTNLLAGDIISYEMIMYGMEILVKFEDGTSYVLDGEKNVGYCGVLEMNENGCYTITEGNNTLTIVYGGKTDTINFTGKVVESIEIQNLPDITDYIAGDRVHVAQLVDGIEVLLKYEDGTNAVKTIDYEDFEENGFNVLGLDEDYTYSVSEGDNTVTVTYRGKATTFNITGHILDSIEITKLPCRTRAVIDSFAGIYYYIEGMEITAYFADGESQVYPVNEMYTEYFDSIKFEGEQIYDNSMLFAAKGENIITLNLNGCIDEFIVTGSDVEKIEIAKMPDLESLSAGSTHMGFVLFEGLEIKVTYDDGFSEICRNENDMYLFDALILYGSNVEYPEWADECLTYAEITLEKGENVFTLDYYGCTTDIVITGTGETSWGDVNRDEVVDVTDVTTLQMHLAGYDVYIPREISDINYDGITDVADVTTLQMMLAGYDI